MYDNLVLATLSYALAFSLHSYKQNEGVQIQAGRGGGDVSKALF